MVVTKNRPCSRVRRKLRVELSREQGGKCYWCAEDMEHYLSPSPKRETLEHIVPLVHGGTNHRSNLAVACMECNLLRGLISSLPPMELQAIITKITLLVGRETR